MIDLDGLQREVDRAYSMLGMNGIPKERAKSISNGIEVLSTRYRREIIALESQLKEAQICKADSEQLDWLQNELKRNGTIVFERHGIEWVNLFTITTQWIKPFSTIREAIYQAINESKLTKGVTYEYR